MAALALTAAEQDRRGEYFNRSGQPWRLVLVEGTQASRGRLVFIDKFSGRRLAVLEKAGDSLALPAGARYLVEYREDPSGFYHDLLLQDGRGHDAEFVATLPDRSEPMPMITLVGHHVGPPLDQATDEAIARSIQDAVDTGEGNLIIFRDYL